MKIEYVTGDLMKAQETVILHGCNARGVMGSGVAALIRKQHPRAYEVYKEEYDRIGEAILGGAIWADCLGDEPSHIVGNLVTQFNFGRDPKVVYADYAAIREAFKKVDSFFAGRRLTLKQAGLDNDVLAESVALPLIGAGLANGSWKTISGIIEDIATHFRPAVYLIDGIVPET